LASFLRDAQYSSRDVMAKSMPEAGMNVKIAHSGAFEIFSRQMGKEWRQEKFVVGEIVA
jgi:hypothetical protein